jgi:hypothetical protein
MDIDRITGENILLIEVKSLDRLHAAHAKQLLTIFAWPGSPSGRSSTSVAQRSRKASADW